MSVRNILQPQDMALAVQRASSDLDQMRTCIAVWLNQFGLSLDAISAILKRSRRVQYREEGRETDCVAMCVVYDALVEVRDKLRKIAESKKSDVNLHSFPVALHDSLHAEPIWEQEATVMEILATSFRVELQRRFGAMQCDLTYERV
jgi:hypothetical protein